ncbi:MAG: PTS sugar transporter subunit IIA [Planctomycetes bacterium]|nr:PTS sugar transporter subunit IIA [Planctomycetota bacterium]MBI3844954.1 PTS sugar transporter subunit IIA [Planctomycetota bacterium]
MNLRRFLRPELIKLRMETTWQEPDDPEANIERLHARLKEAVIRELAVLLAGSDRVGNDSKLFTDLWNREKKATTALGKGIAIPHVRTMQAKELIVAVGFAPDGIPFDSPDGEPVRVFLAMVAPPYDDTLYLRCLKTISTIVSTEGMLDRLLAAKDAHEVIFILGSVES